MKPTVKQRLMAERDKMLFEVQALNNQVKGLQFAIDALRDEEDRAPKGTT